MSIVKHLSILAAVLPAVALAVAEPGLTATLEVFEPDTVVYGKTQAEWSAQWWQYVLSFPTEQSPLSDETGANANNGQSGSVYFLTGVSGSGAAERTITVPNDKAIFFPLINTVNAATAPDETADQLRDQIDGDIEAVDTLFANLDGVDVPNLFNYRQQSPAFSLTLPDNNLFGIVAGTYSPAVSDGYWLMLAPLPEGSYKISFGGTRDAEPGINGLTQNITYNITSVPEPSAAAGTLLLGALGMGWIVKRKLKQKLASDIKRVV